MNIAQIAQGLATLGKLEGRRVRVRHQSDTITVARLTKIVYRRFTVKIGAQQSIIMIPHSIELDGETEYTHALSSIESIEAAS
jgi:hypothetical protein